jgi:hypothetical protein
MKQVWNFEDWKDITVGNMREKFIHRARKTPMLGNLSVSELCCLTTAHDSPVGIYVFTSEDKILYVGKTHGRSLHERAISHIDNRKPKEGSPHLAQFVSSLVKNDAATNADEAVGHLLCMNMTWLPIPCPPTGHDAHKKMIAVIERRLLWKDCLNPSYNSPRVKKNDKFTIKGKVYNISKQDLVGSF